MNNVRDYLKKKKERQNENSRISYREKIKNHKFTIFYRTILVFVLIVAVIAAVYVQWKNKTYTQMNVLASSGVRTDQYNAGFRSSVVFRASSDVQ